MDCYLFPGLGSDETLVRLNAMRDGGEPCRGLYHALFEFVCRDAYTEETVREYVVRLMLRSFPACWREGVMLPYLEQDARTVYDLFFRPDWNGLCLNAGLLPFPRLSGGESRAVTGEAAYREALALMVNADSPETLCGYIAEFFRRYGSEDEAMYRAFSWDGELTGVPDPDPIAFEDLCGLEYQKNAVIANTEAFTGGLSANDMLLVGGSGTGKSSCVKAALNRFANCGLRLVELRRDDLTRLPALLERLSRQRLRYVVFLDDLSFENSDESYLALKNALDGQAAKRPENVLIYATSNRRRIVRESWKDRDAGDDIHENDTINEKFSLSERFGIRLYFPPLTQDEYFDIVRSALEARGAAFTEEIAKRAAAWAIENNGRSGRSAKQFACHYLSCGRS